ncbi:sensor histidine kinase [Actinoplanes sp. NPDC024001]|uniref:sensor histidine kinase n=1 Tax=Actinoplanes sp. NPDC024001 TaxID=3154598 RepID=UPI003403E1B2
MGLRRWRRLTRLPAAYPLFTDVLLALGLTVASVLQGWADPTSQWRPYDATAAMLTVLATAPTALRRRAPTTTLLVCCFFWAVSAAAGYPPSANTYGILLALYTVATVRPWWHVLACAALSAATWIAGVLATGRGSVVSVVATGIVIPAVVCKIADTARRLARAADSLARQAVRDERVRIARELHDVIAHHMSVIAVQAGLARYVLRSDTDTADRALGAVLETATEALDEMRRLLGLLRAGVPAGGEQAPGEPDGFAPAPRLADLPELFNRVRAAGVPVQVTVIGTPAPLPPGMEVCAYRIVQEGLTNVVKHAGPATATVALRYRPDEFVVTIADDGRAVRPAGPVTGKGLIGMRERSLLYGGTLAAGPRTPHGFQVRLSLPLPPP